MNPAAVYKHGGAGRVPCLQCLGTRAGGTFKWAQFVKLLLVACLSVTDDIHHLTSRSYLENSWLWDRPF
jgi:hypothetical protein